MLPKYAKWRQGVFVKHVGTTHYTSDKTLSIHLRYAIRKRKDDLEKWPHAMPNIFGNLNGLQSNNRPQGVSLLWFWFILKVGRTNFSIPLSKVPNHFAFPTVQSIANLSSSQICLVWLLVLQVCTVQKVQQAPEGHISTWHILFRAILWCSHIEEWLLLKGDPVALEPLWLTTVTMLSPSLQLQPHDWSHSRKINNVASSQPPQPQNKVYKSYGGIWVGWEGSGLFYSWVGSEERNKRSINVAEKGQVRKAGGCVLSLLLANALKSI